MDASGWRCPGVRPTAGPRRTRTPPTPGIRLPAGAGGTTPAPGLRLPAGAGLPAAAGRAEEPGARPAGVVLHPWSRQHDERQRRPGIGILVGYLVSILLVIVLVGLLGMLGFWIWGMVDAYQGAQRWNLRHGILS